MPFKNCICNLKFNCEVIFNLFNLTGKTPLEFIHSIRMQRAVQLLEKNEMTVAEVAYEVGFNNPKYFSKFFKQAYNTIPSSYLERKKKEVPE